MDASRSRAVTHAFVRLWEEGLLYRASRLINWCTSCHTALSDLEVEHKDEKGKLWDIAYPLTDGSGEVVVSTTRPETMLGDTAVAVHPDDPRYHSFVGKKVRLPLAPKHRQAMDGRTLSNEIPVVADPVLVDMAFGTGVVKVTPGHDFNDFETGKRHDLPLINILNLDGTLNSNAGVFADRSVERARKEVLNALEEESFLRGEKDHLLSRGRCQRCDTLIEPWHSTQWYVRMKPLAGPAIAAVEHGKTRLIPEGWTKTYMHWMTHIQDWCVSRQLWWGHQIPAWYADDGSVFVARTEEEALQHAEKRFGGLVRLRRDDDVLDTWFSSALWPFSTLGWPERTKDLAAFYPGAVLETGFDILFFWVARMMMMGLHFMGEVPFKDVFLHPMVRDDKGQKMSKTRGNVIDPLDVVHGCPAERLPAAYAKQSPEGWKPQGADALRITLASMAAQGRDVKLSIDRVEGYKAFINKLWNAARFALMRVESQPVPPVDDVRADMDAADRWLLSRLQVVCRHVNEALRAYRLDDATAHIYHFLWDEVCDWYIEMSKPALMEDAPRHRKRATESTLVHVLDQSLRLLHPFCPFVTEEIWQKLPLSRRLTKSLQHAAFPAESADWHDPAAERVVGGAQELCNAVRRLRADAGLPPQKKVPVRVACPGDVRADALQFEEALKRLGGIEGFEWSNAFRPEDTQQCAVLVTSRFQVALPLAGLLDVPAERARLAKEIEKAEKELGGIRGRLDNEGFRARAPQEVVEKDETRATEMGERVTRLRETLGRLQA
jgi:valyl-tRNA synthetase